MKPTEVLDRLTLGRITKYWIGNVALFSIAYYALSFAGSQIIYNSQPITTTLTGLGNSIYFSFITALTLGYGNMAPVGASKALAILEAIGSITLIGAFISKLVSLKQEEIIEEIHELSFEEAVNRTVSELYLIRSQATELKEKVKDKKFNLKLYEEIQQNLTETLSLFNKTKIASSKDKEKTLMHISLVVNSINYSLSRLVELLEKFNNKKIDWKKESTTATQQEIEKIQKTLNEQFNATRSDDLLSRSVAEKLEDLNKTSATLQELIQKS
jgi:superfamily II helicase